MLSILYFLIGIITFYTCKKIILTYDDEHGLTTQKKEYFLIPLCLFITIISITYIYPDIISKIILSIFSGLLFICVYTDKQTKKIYRFFSYLLILTSVIFALFNYKSYFNLDVITVLFFTIYIIIVLVKNNSLGVGDGFVLIGNYIILVTINKNYFLAELVLWHFIIAVLLMIIFNFKKMQWKKLKFKESIAFVPYIYLSTTLISILTIFL